MSRSLAYERQNALNAICPYFTMFPLEYPLRVLRRHRNDKPVVMDPFCGRGTTLFAARKLGLASRGIDSSPVAVAIARAKLATVDAEGVLALAKKYARAHARAPVPDSEFFKSAFAPRVLHTLSAIRRGLLSAGSNNNDVVVLRAAMMGCLHGPTNKAPDQLAYFSNQMPRTFASKPDYSVRYWAAKKLRAPVLDVFDVLKRKLDRIKDQALPPIASASHARHGDSRLAAALPLASRDFSVVVTSPPYYGMRTYIQDQWLRSWFLGGPEQLEYVNDFQLSHAGADAFAKSLGRVWKNMARTRSDRLDMYVRFGIIPSSKVDAKQLMRSSLEESRVGWTVVHTAPAKTASSGRRQADHMVAESTAALEYDFHIRRN